MLVFTVVLDNSPLAVVGAPSVKFTLMVLLLMYDIIGGSWRRIQSRCVHTVNKDLFVKEKLTMMNEGLSTVAKPAKLDIS